MILPKNYGEKKWNIKDILSTKYKKEINERIGYNASDFDIEKLCIRDLLKNNKTHKWLILKL